MRIKLQQKGWILFLITVILASGLFVSTQGLAQKKQISLWVGFTTAPRAPAWREVVNKFNAEYPEVKVVYRTVPDDEMDATLRTSFAGGNPPDLFIVDGWMRLFILEPLLDITDWMEKHKDRFLLSTLWLTRKNGRYYGIPLNQCSVSQLFWNTSIFEKYGVRPDVPTWAEFLNVCEKLKTQGVIPIAHGNRERWPGTQLFMALLSRTCPPDKIDELWQGGPSKWTDPDVVEAGKLYKMLGTKGYLNEGSVGIGYPEAKMLLYGGKSASFHAGNWFVGDAAAEAPQLEYEVIKWPPVIEGENGSYGTLAGGAIELMGVSGPTKHPELCKQFLEFITRVEIQVPLRKQLKDIGDLRGVQTEDIIGAKAAKVADIIVTSTAGTVPFFETVLPASVGEEAFWWGIQQILVGEKTPEEVMENIQIASEKAGMYKY